MRCDGHVLLAAKACQAGPSAKNERSRRTRQGRAHFQVPGAGRRGRAERNCRNQPADAGRLSENGIKTVEDLAGCAIDDLHGWVEQTSGTTTRHLGALDGFGLSRDECGAIIMKARARVGWIDESSPAQPAKAG